MNLFNNLCLEISCNQIKTWRFILLIILFNLLTSFIFSSIAHFFFNKEILEGFENNFGSSLKEQLFWIVLIVPFFETLFYQYAIIETANKIVNPFISCIISALIFGLSHTYNIFYFLFAVVTGFLFATIYYAGSITKRGIFYTFLAHSIYNAIAFILNYVKF
ncbi:CPBP family intramembrane glutamic endopeptidase [Flavobacterium piscis]|uniref:Membrane protease YdiL (CAAX protease family) n=1 Tax=Flavobacterium piscis TaxID=1114874 RepID=A0ABU1Y542_9FLAO|nr:CPBP family intramembrane glutamic endopeptidase [Flavobacterium piscis]MDR7209340.1 membrane protease YdiL (CAAX protease family) [Flavobacterium piscis]